MRSRYEIQAQAAHAEGSKKLTKLCQKPPASRTEQEVSYIQRRVHALMPFFRLWPEALQHELARTLQTEVQQSIPSSPQVCLRCSVPCLPHCAPQVLVRRESVIAHSTIPTRVFFVLEGKVRPGPLLAAEAPASPQHS